MHKLKINWYELGNTQHIPDSLSSERLGRAPKVVCRAGAVLGMFEGIGSIITTTFQSFFKASSAV